ncbi:putative metal-dependent phosphoesterase TrpH [Halohasta litchfieldiae]|uniref:Predicted metal-dependent phosphoesterase TrpH, contains PHP domain n=2 Tax=Halohasta litchfieldiae TaxID=1073996 RepID=A0A1H6X492_9EURY|nr:putative metal-dependent phosphoesterase TrpH [Halohasta litchfieldiae]SEJ23949.1 Predicted metal-dependent phosphoesterase TrpH, contains PHP domain [Halohasta litchfieldiae]
MLSKGRICQYLTSDFFPVGLIVVVDMDIPLQIDLHVHSDGSYDGSEPVDLILEHAADIGLDGVVITDHDAIGESLRAAELAPEYGLIGIPGVEVSTAHGHLLAIGVEEMPPRREPYAETVDWIRDHGGVAIVPHPFQRTRHGVRKKNIPDVDAIESFNAWLFTGYKNRRARRFADAHGYPAVAASDAHTLPYVGRAYTEITLDAESRDSVTASDVCAAIREGSTAVQGRRAPIPMAAKHYCIGAARKSGYYAKAGAVTTASYAKFGALKGGSLAKLGAVKSVRGVAGVVSAIK